MDRSLDLRDPRKVYYQLTSILRNPAYSKYVSFALLIFDLLLSVLIVEKIPYTEIDWETYMQQVSVFRKGERNYRNISGDTGPLVYPAGHVYIFNFLYEITDGGSNRRRCQAIFGGIYILTLWVVLRCYRMAKVPPWVLPLLVLSKRLHSIYLLRFFNDCVCVLFVFLSIWLMMQRRTNLAALLYSLSVSVKMSSLLYLPAVGIVTRYTAGRNGALLAAFIIVQTQVALALPFCISKNGDAMAYMGRAFELSRQFLWKWTVNWRFVGEENFLSSTFHYLLLALHLILLCGFLFTRWRTHVTNRGLPDFISYFLTPVGKTEEEAISKRCTPDFVLTTMLSCNMIGVLCARSLHYQFYSWVAWGTPFLLWKSGFNFVFVYTIWLFQEVAWNIYPSTNISSALLVSSMGIQLAGVWMGTRTARSPGSERPKNQ